jgi:hypothetical protein
MAWMLFGKSSSKAFGSQTKRIASFGPKKSFASTQPTKASKQAPSGPFRPRALGKINYDKSDRFPSFFSGVRKRNFLFIF